MDLLDRFLRKIIREGELTLIDPSGRKRTYGRDCGTGRRATVRLADRKVVRDVLRQPKVAIGEAYMDGRLILEQGDILDLLDLATSNVPWERGGRSRKAIGRGSRKLAGALWGLNDRRRSARNVAHHYDLSDRLYDLFLDSDRQYSCAYFNDPTDTLEQAQTAKKAHIAAKLYLKPGQRVLDIGCGWGGMALYLHSQAEVDVLGITLSQEQLQVARRRAEEAGVADRVKFELLDYRNVEGRFDRIVSVGMFEHVGRRHFGQFFQKCRQLLKDDGVMLLHTIGRMGAPGLPNRWTSKYIFPGYYVPALSEMVASSEKAKLIAADVEMLRLHYAYTLEHWYRRVQDKRREIVDLYDERFLRMWEFYLASTIVGFRHGGMINYQVQYIRDRHALPITRDYMIEEEARLRS
ncbi:MAG TPA: cyclopropane-fatty-acyl-phospholipid synthase family protein [Allosphingosinicella sp.]|nr:cyclopropane-fatty-acyl-phospholipid synthase family protein [Allosphingosinicella sp.]